MGRREFLTLRSASSVGLFFVALALGGYVARPIHGASVAFDSQVAVLDFSRLVTGRQVEVFLSTTPKPLLTFIFGPLELLTHDWRTVAWATLVAFALAVVLSAELARRFGGPVAWAFVGIGLAGSGALLFDVGYALAVPWALLGCALAGLALCRPQPRYGLAGIALMLATLARLETILIVAVAALVLLALAVPRIGRAATAAGIRLPPRRAWLLLIGLTALPIMCVHDLLIYGNPLFWSTVSVRYSAVTANHILSPESLLHWMIDRYRGLWPLTLLALIGVASLCRKRAWVILLGLLAMGPGMVAFLEYLAARHIFVPDRYIAPVDIAVIIAAGFGVALLAEVASRAVKDRSAEAAPARWVATGTLAVAMGVSAVTTWPTGLLSAPLLAAVHNSLALAEDLDQMGPVLRQAVDRAPNGHTWPTAGGSAAPPAGLLLVPQAYHPRMSVDLDAPLTIIGGNDPRLGPTLDQLAPGELIVHDRHTEGSGPAWQPFSTTIPVTFDGVSLLPVASDPARGWWITQVQTAR